MHYGYHGAMGYGFGFGGALLHLLGFVILIAIIVIAVRLIMGKNMRWRHLMHGHALGILKERYAKGEIDKKEFEEKKKDLQNDGSRATEAR